MLNAKSYYCPVQIQAVANSLISKSVRLIDEDTKEQQITNEIKTALKQNRCTNCTINEATLRKEEDPTHQTDTKKQKGIMPHVRGVISKRGKVLERRIMKTTCKSTSTINNIINIPKDKTKLENQGHVEIAVMPTFAKQTGEFQLR